MHRFNLILGVLLGLTLTAWMLGDYLHGSWLLLGVFGITAIKGQLVIDHFMELAHAPRLFRYAVSGWLLVVLTALVVIGQF